MRAERGPSSGMISPGPPSLRASSPAAIRRSGATVTRPFRHGGRWQADRRTLRQRRQPGRQLPLQRSGSAPCSWTPGPPPSTTAGLEDRHQGSGCAGSPHRSGQARSGGGHLRGGQAAAAALRTGAGTMTRQPGAHPLLSLFWPLRLLSLRGLHRDLGKTHFLVAHGAFSSCCSSASACWASPIRATSGCGNRPEPRCPPSGGSWWRATQVWLDLPGVGWQDRLVDVTVGRPCWTGIWASSCRTNSGSSLWR